MGPAGEEAEASHGDVAFGCGLSAEAEEDFDHLALIFADVNEFTSGAHVSAMREREGVGATLKLCRWP